MYGIRKEPESQHERTNNHPSLVPYNQHVRFWRHFVHFGERERERSKTNNVRTKKTRNKKSRINQTKSSKTPPPPMLRYLDSYVGGGKLPTEMWRDCIAPFLICKLPTDLLHDIRDFRLSYHTIMALYHEIWTIEFQGELGEHVRWFENEVHIFGTAAYADSFHSELYRRFFREMYIPANRLTRRSPPPSGNLTRLFWGSLCPRLRLTFVRFRSMPLESIVELTMW